MMRIFKKNQSRRNFLQWLMKSLSLSALLPALRLFKTPFSRAGVSDKNTNMTKSGAEPIKISNSRSRTLLKNGLIVDGTGGKSFKGDLLINGDKIERVSAQGIDFTGKTIDCTDRHSG